MYKNKTKDGGRGAWRSLLHRLAALIVVFALLALAGSALASCAAKRSVSYVELPHTARDTVRLTTLKIQTDTVRDSVFVDRTTELRGDTVLVTLTKYKEAIRFRDRILRDTVFRARTDTISIPVTVTKEIPRALTLWQRILLALGRALLATLFAAFALLCLKVYRKWRK